MLAPGRRDELERGEAVVREQLGMVLRAAEDSIQSAARACFAARSARGIWP